MKIIDLWNKIANGEKIPKKIYCFNREFYLKGNTYFGDTFTLMHYIREENLNDEVKIIEEEKKIPEKLPFECGKISDNDFLAKYISHNRNAINEIIDYLEYFKSKGDK